MNLCVFSKRLQSLDFPALGRALKGIGLDGVDLTVRPGGHVEPAEVADVLPKAVAALRSEGVAVAMISTGITSVDDPHARTVLETAARLDIRWVKLGYVLYEGFGTLRRTLAEVRGRLTDLAALAGDLGLFLGCHNHSGPYIGAHVAHLGRLVDGLDPDAIGIYFDPAHAVVEGGHDGWRQALDDVADRVRMLAIKDFTLGADGRAECVPVGEGIVRWPEMIEALTSIGHQIGPVSIHAEPDVSADEALNLAAHDKAAFESLWGA